MSNLHRTHVASSRRPAADYAEAAGRVMLRQDDERARLHPNCVTRFMSHGGRVNQSVVLVHGYTSCPQQFEAFGTRLFELGQNVLIVPLPHHGLSAPRTREDVRLTAGELAAYCDQVLDIAAGLGKRVTIAGLSAGGLVAAWAGQFRSDVDLAVAIAPTFGVRAIPSALTPAASVLLGILPNFFTWWDRLPVNDPRAAYMYPTFATHALAQLMGMGAAIRAEARRRAPAAGRIVVILNADDRAVNNELTLQIVRLWRGQMHEVTVYEFPVSLRLPHDLVDPENPSQNIATVYPALIDLIAGPGTGQPARG